MNVFAALFPGHNAVEKALQRVVSTAKTESAPPIRRVIADHLLVTGITAKPIHVDVLLENLKTSWAVQDWTTARAILSQLDKVAWHHDLESRADEAGVVTNHR